jgi:hypothetical protein
VMGRLEIITWTYNGASGNYRLWANTFSADVQVRQSKLFKSGSRKLLVHSTRWDRSRVTRLCLPIQFHLPGRVGPGNFTPSLSQIRA